MGKLLRVLKHSPIAVLLVFGVAGASPSVGGPAAVTNLMGGAVNSLQDVVFLGAEWTPPAGDPAATMYEVGWMSHQIRGLVHIVTTSGTPISDDSTRLYVSGQMAYSVDDFDPLVGFVIVVPISATGVRGKMQYAPIRYCGPCIFE